MDRAWGELAPLLAADQALADEFWWQTAVDEPDRILERFLVGCKHDSGKAVQAVVKFLKWRASFHVRQLVYSGEAGGLLPRHLWESGKGIFWGYDKDGFLVVYMHPRRHNMRLQSREDTTRHIVYQIELGRRLFQGTKDRVTVVVDMQDTGLDAMDVSCALFVLTCLQGYYPESLNKILVVNANFVFYYLLAAVQPVLDRAVSTKVVQLSAPTELLQFIDAEYLMAEYGGQSDYRYKYIEPVPAGGGAVAHQHHLARLTMQAEELRSQFAASPHDAALKARIKAIYRQMDRLIYPGDLYTRMGVATGPGSIDWKANKIADCR